MSFLPGFGRPQPSSAEKIANAETEMDMITEMMSRYRTILFPPFRLPSPIAPFFPIPPSHHTQTDHPN